MLRLALALLLDDVPLRNPGFEEAAVDVPRGARPLDVLGNPLPSRGRISVGIEPIYLLR